MKLKFLKNLFLSTKTLYSYYAINKTHIISIEIDLYQQGQKGYAMW